MARISDVNKTFFQVLYTHQKTKKHKIWQDGTLQQVDANGHKFLLFSEDGKEIDCIYTSNAKSIKEGDEIETDRHLINVEEVFCSALIADADHITKNQSRLNEVSVSTTHGRKPNIVRKWPEQVLQSSCVNNHGNQVLDQGRNGLKRSANQILQLIGSIDEDDGTREKESLTGVIKKQKLSSEPAEAQTTEDVTSVHFKDFQIDNDFYDDVIKDYHEIHQTKGDESCICKPRQHSRWSKFDSPSLPVYQYPSSVYQYPSPVYQYPSPVYQHPSPVYQHPSPVYQYPSPVYQYPSPVYQYPSPVYQYPSPVYQYPSPVYQYPLPAVQSTAVATCHKPVASAPLSSVQSCDSTQQRVLHPLVTDPDQFIDTTSSLCTTTDLNSLSDIDTFYHNDDTTAFIKGNDICNYDDNESCGKAGVTNGYANCCNSSSDVSEIGLVIENDMFDIIGLDHLNSNDAKTSHRYTTNCDDDNYNYYTQEVQFPLQEYDDDVRQLNRDRTAVDSVITSLPISASKDLSNTRRQTAPLHDPDMVLDRLTTKDGRKVKFIMADPSINDIKSIVKLEEEFKLGLWSF